MPMVPKFRFFSNWFADCWVSISGWLAGAALLKHFKYLSDYFCIHIFQAVKREKKTKKKNKTLKGLLPEIVFLTWPYILVLVFAYLLPNIFYLVQNWYLIPIAHAVHGNCNQKVICAFKIGLCHHLALFITVLEFPAGKITIHGTSWGWQHSSPTGKALKQLKHLSTVH